MTARVSSAKPASRSRRLSRIASSRRLPVWHLVGRRGGPPRGRGPGRPPRAPQDAAPRAASPPAPRRYREDPLLRSRAPRSRPRPRTGTAARRSLELLRDLDDDRALFAARGGHALRRLPSQQPALLADLSKACQEHRFALGVLVVCDATFFELDLQLEELLARRL